MAFSGSAQAQATAETQRVEVTGSSIRRIEGETAPERIERMAAARQRPLLVPQPRREAAADADDGIGLIEGLQQVLAQGGAQGI